MNSGQIIKQIIEKNGIKQNWLAKKLEIPASTLNTALKKEVPFDLLVDICDVLKIPINEIRDIYKEKKDTDSPAKNESVSKQTKLHK